MVGLILKDFLNLRKNVKIFFTFIIIYGAMAYVSHDSSFFSTVFTILCAILVLNLYAFDEAAKWDGYALTMPISRDNIVQGKYIMMLILTAIGVLLGTIFTITLYFTMNIGSPISSLKSCTIGAGISVLFYSIALPLITKLGVEKAKFLLLAIYMIPFTGIIIIGKAIDSGDLVCSKQLVDIGWFIWNNIFLFIFVVMIVAVILSYTFSVSIYRKKEF